MENAYSGILHRLPDKEGYNYYSNQLSDGKMKKGDVIFALANSEEKGSVDGSFGQKIHKIKRFRFF